MKIRVRIKLAVGSDGTWNAGGYGGASGAAEDSGEWVMDGMPPYLSLEDIRVVYVEADVEVPTAQVIQGRVTE